MKSKILKRCVSVLSAAALTASLAAVMPMTASASGLSSETSAFLESLGAGWNLGNTLDATGGSGVSSETSWGCPKTTKEMIEAVHDAGFETIRIPVSWGNHMSSDYTVDEAWMARVKEVVDYAYEDGMNVILNVHHDNGTGTMAYYPDSEHKEASLKFLTSVWTQIADEFKDYDDRLIFETLNEPRLTGTDYEWWFNVSNPGSVVEDSVATINEFNQEIVNVIRNSGSENATRYIMCPGYAASLNGVLVDGFEMPTDTVSDRILLSVHGYSPSNFCLGDSKDITTAKYVQFTDSGKAEVDSLFEQLNTNFLSKGIGVVIGENGCSNKDNNDARTAWAEYTFTLSKKYNIPNVIWDNNAKNGSTKSENHWYFNRKTLKWGAPDVVNAIMTAMGVENAVIPADDDIVTKTAQKISGTSSYTKTFGDSTFTLDAKNTSSNGGALGYSSSDTSVVTVNNSGVVTVKGAGTATITVTANETSAYKSATFSVKVTVNALAVTPKTAAIADQEYTGSAIEPKLSITYNSRVLTKDKDYTVTYSNNVNPGTATAKVTLMGNYKGTYTVTFKIIGETADATATAPAKVTIKKTAVSTTAAKITWSKSSDASGYIVYRYNDSTKKWAKIKTISSADTTSYKDTGLKAATAYKYCVKAYTTANGSKLLSDKSKTVTVVTKPKATAFTKSSASTKAIKLTWKKVSCTGYKLQKYNTSTKKWENVKKLKSTVTSYKVTGLKKNTSYKFRIIAYKTSGSIVSYSAWSNTYSVKTKK